MRKILSILLTFILLASNLGFAVASHSCGGTIVESKLIFGQENLDCGMPSMDEPHAEFPDQETVYSKGTCCENSYEYLDTEDNYSKNVTSKLLDQQFSTVDHFSLNSISLGSFETLNNPHSSPPLVERDILILHQVFLL